MPQFPQTRMRRLRRSAGIRRMVQEHSLCVDDLILPLFVVPGRNVCDPIGSMPGCFRFSVDRLVEECREVEALGIPGVILFGIPEAKDAAASGAYAANGIVQQALRALREAGLSLELITDVCLCEYTDHGHCGPLCADGQVDNDAALDLLARTAISHVDAGATMVAPSDMMDGRVAAIRAALDAAGNSAVPIMAYSAKYASAYYGPFREAAESAPQTGDRKGYQMNPGNSNEAVEEALLDVDEGTDIIMVKPALAYLDIVRKVRETVLRPVAAYNVSGEYAMIKAAAAQGWIDERKTVMETLLCMKRAGADIILTYHAKEAARWLRESAR